MQVTPIHNFNNKQLYKKVATAGILGTTAVATCDCFCRSKLDNLSEKMNSKILNLKNSNNEHVFNKKTLKILSKASAMKDSTFYDLILKNIDNLEEISETRDINNNRVYIANLKNDEVIEANEKGSYIYHSKKDGERTIIKNRTSTSMGYTERKIVVENSKLLSHERVDFDYKNNTITRQNFDVTGKTQEDYYKDTKLLHSSVTKFSKYGAIDVKTTTDVVEDDTTLKKYKNEIDYKNQTKTNAIYSGEIKSPLSVAYQKYEYINPLTNKKETQILTKSDVEGIFNSKIIDENGNERIECVGLKNGNEIKVEKNLISLDGTKTHHIITKNGNNTQTFYEIKDKNGNIITTVERTFKKISDTKAFSSINGHEYAITKLPKEYEVTDLNSNETVKIKVKDLVKTKNIFTAKSDIKDAQKILDKVSGDTLLTLAKQKTRIKPETSIYKSAFNYISNILNVSDEMFVFNHEVGHSKDTVYDLKSEDDTKYLISNNEEFLKTYNEEKQAFKKAFTELHQNYVSYFTDKEYYDDYVSGGPCEAIAEINAIFSTAIGLDETAYRTFYLQKFFPKSIAIASRLLNPNSNIFIK